MSPIRSQPYQRLQNTLLGVTLLGDLITLLGVAWLEVFEQFNWIATLLEDLQIVVKPTWLRDLVTITTIRE